MKKRVAIIGAGVSGLPAIKCCLDEDLEPVCFERTGDIGGLWNYEQGLKIPNRTCVTNFTIANTSKEMSCYSDFPFPKEYPLFPPHNQMLDYLKLYAKNFNLIRHVNFNTEILKVRQTTDFAATGNWCVAWRNVITNEEGEEIFSAVLMCSGRYSAIKQPTFKDQEQFMGKIIHSRDYKSHHGFENKTIVVVGLKNTGGDIAAELSGHGSKVYVSSRKGVWMGGRLKNGGQPSDCVLSRRAVYSVISKLPAKWSAAIMKRGINSRFDQTLFGIEPAFSPGLFTGPLAVNDLLPERIISGRVIVKPNIHKLTKTAVHFVDGTVVDNVDVIIFATGYEISLPYLGCDSFIAQNDNIDLYNFMFAPDVFPPTIALIGCLAALSAVMPLAEMQCRLATRVFKGDVSLPSEVAMKRKIADHRQNMDSARRKLNFKDDTASYMFEHYLSYMTNTADLCGCRPTLFKLLLMDRRLVWSYLFGPVVPAQFRLCGHGAWEGAKETVLTVEERNKYPYPRLYKPDHSKQHSWPTLQKTVIVILALYLLLFVFVF